MIVCILLDIFVLNSITSSPPGRSKPERCHPEDVLWSLGSCLVLVRAKFVYKFLNSSEFVISKLFGP